MSWDYQALRARIDEAVEEYTRGLARERVTVSVGPVSVVLRLDGSLADVVLDPRAPHRYDSDALAALVVEAIRAAEHEVTGRRDVLAGTVTFLGHPVLEVVQEMMTDPHAAARRLGTAADTRR